jgi:hypothetical protein
MGGEVESDCGGHVHQNLHKTPNSVIFEAKYARCALRQVENNTKTKSHHCLE